MNRAHSSALNRMVAKPFTLCRLLACMFLSRFVLFKEIPSEADSFVSNQLLSVGYVQQNSTNDPFWNTRH